MHRPVEPVCLEYTRLQDLPADLLDTPARALHRLLDGPTLLHLPGRHGPELFVSVLLHGNEDVGWVAVQQLLREALAHGQRLLPRALTVLVGNVAAAREGLRRLDGQPDHNRVWPGHAGPSDRPEHALMRAVQARVLQHAAARGGLFAAVDLHNNTGRNPHYGIVTRLDAASLHLARLFSRTVVLFRGLPGTQTAAFAGLAPAVALECGLPGVPAHEAAATRFLQACLQLSHFPAQPPAAHDLDLYHSLARVVLRDEVDFDFAPEHALEEAIDAAMHGAGPTLRLAAGLDRLNFRELEAGHPLGRSRHPMPVQAFDEHGRDIAADCLRCDDGRLRLARRLMPAMLTLDARVLRQDCLCYLMERLPASALAAPAQRVPAPA